MSYARLLLLLSCLAVAPASWGQLVVHPGAFSTAGGVTNGGDFELISSVGDAAASITMSGGGFSLTGGIVAIASTGAVPSIVHEEPEPVSGSEEVPIAVQVDGAVHSATLLFRVGGEAEFQEVPMTREGNEYVAVIPDDQVGSRGLTYFVLVEDELGRMFRSPALGTYTLQVRIGGEGIVRDMAQPAGTDQSAYRLVSFPVQPDDPDPESVLVDDLGAYDPEVWRFFSLDFNQEYQELPDIEVIQTGEGYWLITSEPDRVLDTGPGLSAPTNEPFEILLHPRWNLIGTPFHFPVDISQVRLTSGRPLALRSIANGWNDPVREPVRTLRPFEGYAVFNDLQRVDTLLVYPHAIGSGKTAPSFVAAKTSEVEWTLHVSAETRTARDADNVVGVRAGALDTYDAMDYPEPPRYGDFVSLHFPRPEWEAPADAFCTDFRSVSEEGYVWELSVESGKAEVVQLRFDAVEDLPADLQAWIVDERLSVASDLRADPRYQLVTADGQATTLRLVVGTADFVAEHRPEPTELPTRLSVTDVFPNPFSNAATVRYVLPQHENVRIRVFNALGAEVARLVDGDARDAGAHLVVWDGRRSDGAPAASGVYFLQFTAGQETKTAKVVLVR